MERPFDRTVDPWFWILYMFGGIFWIGGIVTDANAERISWVVVNILIPPIGILRGIGNLFP